MPGWRVDQSNDLRVYFAAERTLLAWVRTGVTIVGLGFVVARFGLFLRVIHPTRPSDSMSTLGSTTIGVILVLFGALGVVLAAWSHVRYCKQLRIEELPRGRWVFWPVVYALTLAVLGTALAIYLMLLAEV